jgi:hypothetical protein
LAATLADTATFADAVAACEDCDHVQAAAITPAIAIPATSRTACFFMTCSPP